RLRVEEANRGGEERFDHDVADRNLPSVANLQAATALLPDVHIAAGNPLQFHGRRLHAEQSRIDLRGVHRREGRAFPLGGGPATRSRLRSAGIHLLNLPFAAGAFIVRGVNHVEGGFRIRTPGGGNDGRSWFRLCGLVGFRRREGIQHVRTSRFGDVPAGSRGGTL